MVQLEQISALIDFVEVHRELAYSYVSRTHEGRTLAKRLWVECAQILNNVTSNCPKKTPVEWRTFFNEYKSKIFKKVRLQKREISTTGSVTKTALTPLQERLKEILDSGEVESSGSIPLQKQRISHYPPSQSESEDTRTKHTNTQRIERRNRINNEVESGFIVKDEFTMYGDLVAMKLRKITNSYAQSTAQYHINNILYRAEIGEYDKPGTSKDREGNTGEQDPNCDVALTSSTHVLSVKIESEDSSND